MNAMPSMRSRLLSELQTCADVRSALDCALACSLELTGTHLGNVQLMDWKTGCLEITTQRGFGAEFLAFFKQVRLEDSTACGRVLQSRSTIVIDDVMADPGFAPYRQVAGRAGVRAVQSTPLISRNGALVGVLSNHFSTVRRPTAAQLERLREAAELAANAVIRLRASDEGRLLVSSLHSLEQSFRTLEEADKLLARRRHG